MRLNEHLASIFRDVYASAVGLQAKKSPPENGWAKYKSKPEEEGVLTSCRGR